MIVVSSQKVGYISWVLVVMDYATSVMDHCWFITQPRHTDTNIHIIFTCTYYNHIIRLCKS